MAIRRARRRGAAAPLGGVAVAATALVWPGVSAAHAFGARYDLPLPLWLYLTGAGAAVALSFAVIALLVREPAPLAGLGVAPQPGRTGWPLRALRVVAVALLAIVVASALAGPTSPTRSFAAVFVWVLWWVGFWLLQALVVDLWSVANPWRTLAGWIGAASARRAPPLAWPHRLGCWPAVAGFVVFAWLELVSTIGEQPRTLGWLVVGYGAVTLAGAWLFGARRWFGAADPFSVVFAVLGRMAPIGLDGERLRLRAPGAGLIAGEPAGASLGVLVLCLLATVSFDGFKETAQWADALDAIAESEALRAPLLAARSAGADLLVLIETLGLLASVAVFAGAYAVFAVLIDRASGRAVGLRRCAGSFVTTLVPIAVGYHLAHYLSYLLIAGQLAIPLASDPLGRGHDLLGTAGYAVDISIIDARAVWFTAVASIVAGHVLAVVLAHVTALRLYGNRVAAVRSQLPMLVLMVGYTASSLWILSQPVVAA